jgi:hypothetical protein
VTRLLAVVRALRFHNPDGAALQSIPPGAWSRLLRQTDEARLTLALGVRCREFLPEHVRARIENDLGRNAVRQRRLRAALLEITRALEARGVEYAILKGASHWPYFCDSPDHRPQYDIDLFSPTPGDARSAIESLGYNSLNGRKDGPVDHLPVMVRPTSWQWRGDYFDPEQPPSVKVHFRFWSRETEAFEVEGLHLFWQRRALRDCGGLAVPALALTDTLSYASLHLLRHLLRGSLRLYHGYELAHFLERSADDGAFWNAWVRETPASFRELQGVVFHLVARWFDCRLHPLAQEHAGNLPRPVRQWCERFAYSPITAADVPNKDELLLHLHLAPQPAARRRILTRRLFPQPSQAAGSRRLAARALHHARALLSLARSVVPWLCAQRNRRPRAGIAPE